LDYIRIHLAVLFHRKALRTMVPENSGPPQVPRDRYADDPKEWNDYLAKYSLQFDLKKAIKDSSVVNTQAVDDMLSRELLQLSLQDRNAINEEIHGVQTFAPEETPEMLAEALNKMETEINNIPIKEAFDRSQQFPNTYVNSAEFRLRFLRSDLFEAKSAAKKLVKFLELVAKLFGDFALRRQIHMSDFSREEMQAFRVGHQQLLPYRDRSGRRIFALVGNLGINTVLVTRVSVLEETLLNRQIGLFESQTVLKFFTMYIRTHVGIYAKYLTLVSCVSWIISNRNATGEDSDLHSSSSVRRR
jgi:hypothetical protein